MIYFLDSNYILLSSPFPSFSSSQSSPHSPSQSAPESPCRYSSAPLRDNVSPLRAESSRKLNPQHYHQQQPQHNHHHHQGSQLQQRDITRTPQTYAHPQTYAPATPNQQQLCQRQQQQQQQPPAQQPQTQAQPQSPSQKPSVQEVRV